MIGFEQRVAIAYVEIGIIDVVQKHIDAAKVVGGDIQLLTEETFLHIVLAENLGKFQQQRTRTAGGVIYLIDVFTSVAHNASKQFRHLLRRVVFATAFAGI